MRHLSVQDVSYQVIRWAVTALCSGHAVLFENTPFFEPEFSVSEEVKACVQVAGLCCKNGLFQGPGDMPVWLLAYRANMTTSIQIPRTHVGGWWPARSSSLLWQRQRSPQSRLIGKTSQIVSSGVECDIPPH